jgi:TPR repeat protein
VRHVLFGLALALLLGGQAHAQTQPETQTQTRAQAQAGFRDGLMSYHRGDHVRAYEIWRPLAEQGDSNAQYSLGLLYYRGEGVLTDLAAAANWYRKAADQGDPDAQLNLGLMYARGQGVRQSDLEAYKWFTLAFRTYDAGENRDTAFRNRENLAGVMTKDQIAKAERLAERWTSKTR